MMVMVMMMTVVVGVCVLLCLCDVCQCPSQYPLILLESDILVLGKERVVKGFLPRHSPASISHSGGLRFDPVSSRYRYRFFYCLSQ